MTLFISIKEKPISPLVMYLKRKIYIRREAFGIDPL